MLRSSTDAWDLSVAANIFFERKIAPIVFFGISYALFRGVIGYFSEPSVRRMCIPMIDSSEPKRVSIWCNNFLLISDGFRIYPANCPSHQAYGCWIRVWTISLGISYKIVSRGDSERAGIVWQTSSGFKPFLSMIFQRLCSANVLNL